MMIDLLLVNDIRTDVHAMSVWLILLAVLALAVSAGVVSYRYRRVTCPYPWAWLTVGCTLVYVSVFGISVHSDKVLQRMPFSFYDAISQYVAQRHIVAEERPLLDGCSEEGSDSLTVVLIIGESLRADHLQLNGYRRATTPLLSREPNLVSLPHVWSRYSYTHLSIPHLLTRADDAHPERAYTERSLISVLNEAGYRTAWLSNQESVETFVYFMKECDTLVYANGGGSIGMFDAWLDEDLLPLLDSELERTDNRRFILLHTIGSHWFYNAHFSSAFERWKPLARHRVVMLNSKEELCNSYDNTILYSDWFWKSVIDRLRQRKAVLFYVSDHGESLGEDGQYWHGADRPEQLNVASFVWFSDRYADCYPEKVKALKEHSSRKMKTDYVFHSVVSAAMVQSSATEEPFDIFRSEKPLEK
jgi:glucan phosphoethanolaminetransferase (alkaline phosphatase superfamily)